MSTPELSERETIIGWTLAEKADGYFTFYTSIQDDYNRLIKAIGGAENLLALELQPRRTGPGHLARYFAAKCRVPIRYLGRTNFAIRTPRPTPASAHRRASSERMKMLVQRQRLERKGQKELAAGSKAPKAEGLPEAK